MNKNNIDIGIVLVNYNNFEDTVECVESFVERLDTHSFKIIILDNCSPNKSGEELKKKYHNNNYVDVILSETNTGNTGGWNAGLTYMKEYYNPKFVVLSDNDILLIDRHFFEHIDEEFKRSHFTGLAPMIMTPNGRCDANPIFDTWYSRENATYDLKYWKKRLRATKLRIDKLYCFCRAHNPFVKIHKKKVYSIRKDKTPGIYLKRRENIVLHGCFLIFSPIFFEHFDGLDQRTFMYAEEDILFAHFLKEKLKTVYNPEICVYHKGDGSVKNSYTNNRKRSIFLFSNYIKAIEAYLLLLDELKL